MSHKGKPRIFRGDRYRHDGSEEPQVAATSAVNHERTDKALAFESEQQAAVIAVIAEEKFVEFALHLDGYQRQIGSREAGLPHRVRQFARRTSRSASFSASLVPADRSISGRSREFFGLLNPWMSRPTKA